MTSPRLRRITTSWGMWALVLIVLVAVLTVALTQDRGPQTQQERIEAISARLACPTCDGESVEVSRAAAAVAIRTEIARQVALGQRTNDEIVAEIENSFGGRVLLVPRATGLDALVWVLPVTAGVIAVAALGATFRRWRREAEVLGTPSEEDRRRVDAALAEDSDGS